MRSRTAREHLHRIHTAERGGALATAHRRGHAERGGALAAAHRRGDAERGSTLLLSLLILSALSILASTVVVTAMGERNLTKYERHSLMALGAAESGVALAKRQIVTQTANMQDFDADGRPDFTINGRSAGAAMSM